MIIIILFACVDNTAEKWSDSRRFLAKKIKDESLIPAKGNTEAVLGNTLQASNTMCRYTHVLKLLKEFPYEFSDVWLTASQAWCY